eukprot:7339567-Lingulodinium_polyedra.AAC.1
MVGGSDDEAVFRGRRGWRRAAVWRPGSWPRSFAARRFCLGPTTEASGARFSCWRSSVERWRFV